MQSELSPSCVRKHPDTPPTPTPHGLIHSITISFCVLSYSLRNRQHITERRSLVSCYRGSAYRYGAVLPTHKELCPTSLATKISLVMQLSSITPRKLWITIPRHQGGMLCGKASNIFVHFTSLLGSEHLLSAALLNAILCIINCHLPLFGVVVSM